MLAVGVSGRSGRKVHRAAAVRQPRGESTPESTCTHLCSAPDGATGCHGTSAIHGHGVTVSGNSVGPSTGTWPRGRSCGRLSEVPRGTRPCCPLPQLLLQASMLPPPAPTTNPRHPATSRSVFGVRGVYSLYAPCCKVYLLCPGGGVNACRRPQGMAWRHGCPSTGRGRARPQAAVQEGPGVGTRALLEAGGAGLAGHKLSIAALVSRVCHGLR